VLSKRGVFTVSVACLGEQVGVEQVGEGGVKEGGKREVGCMVYTTIYPSIYPSVHVNVHVDVNLVLTSFCVLRFVYFIFCTSFPVIHLIFNVNTRMCPFPSSSSSLPVL